MEQAKPKLGKIVKERDKITKMLGLKIGDLDGKFPIQKAFTGIWDLMIPIKSKKALFEISPDFEKIEKFCKENNIVSFHAFTLDEENAAANTRNFSPLYGINEESATGTSNGALAYYLYFYKTLKKEKIYKIIQGESMNRKSEIYVKITEKDIINVGGKAKTILFGMLKI